MKIKGSPGIKTNICFKCNGKINPTKDNFIKLISYNDGEVIEEVWMHLGHDGGCWSKYNTEKIENQLGKMSNVGMKLLKNMGMKC